MALAADRDEGFDPMTYQGVNIVLAIILDYQGFFP
jgi:hypothetical protein